MTDGDISTPEADEKEQIEDSNKKFLYARAIHSNHMHVTNFRASKSGR